QREVDLPVSLNLCAPPGTRLSDVTTVVSHPNPLGQARVWRARHLPDATTGAANPPAEAALQVARSRKKALATTGPPQGAKHAGLARCERVARRAARAGPRRARAVVIDLRRLRDEPAYRTGIERKRVDPALVDAVLAADAVHRELQHRVEELRARQNAASKEI